MCQSMYNFISFYQKRQGFTVTDFNSTSATGCRVDWCPPAGFTVEVWPVIYRDFNNTDNIQLHNRAK